MGVWYIVHHKPNRSLRSLQTTGLYYINP